VAALTHIKATASGDGSNGTPSHHSSEELIDVTDIY